MVHGKVSDHNFRDQKVLYAIDCCILRFIEFSLEAPAVLGVICSEMWEGEYVSRDVLHVYRAVSIEDSFMERFTLHLEVDSLSRDCIRRKSEVAADVDARLRREVLRITEE